MWASVSYTHLVEIREALGQVHRPIAVGDAGHPADDGIGKVRRAAGQILHVRSLLLYVCVSVLGGLGGAAHAKVEELPSPLLQSPLIDHAGAADVHGPSADGEMCIRDSRRGGHLIFEICDLFLKD